MRIVDPFDVAVSDVVADAFSVVSKPKHESRNPKHIEKANAEIQNEPHPSSWNSSLRISNLFRVSKLEVRISRSPRRPVESP